MDTVTGEIELPVGVRLAAGAVIRVSLLDTSLADAPSTMVDEQEIFVATQPALTFVLRCVEPNPGNNYSVRVHVDQDGDGRVSRGDFVNAQSYPVLTFGHPNHVTVRTVIVG